MSKSFVQTVLLVLGVNLTAMSFVQSLPILGIVGGGLLGLFVSFLDRRF